jgi:mono/diheme cytochrome c family protein
MRTTNAIAGLALCSVALVACRGNRSELPPVHLQQNMDFQQRFDPQERNPLFQDGRAMREPVAGTVAIGFLKDDDHLWRGRGIDGRLVDTLPAAHPLTDKLLARGQQRYGIYCAPCHGDTGNGNGVVTRRGGGFKVQPKSLHEERLRAMPLGYFYKVMTEGQGTMLSYASQVPVEDRWAITAWVRTLQVSQQASAADVPGDAQGNPVPIAIQPAMLAAPPEGEPDTAAQGGAQ